MMFLRNMKKIENNKKKSTTLKEEKHDDDDDDDENNFSISAKSFYSSSSSSNKNRNASKIPLLLSSSKNKNVEKNAKDLERSPLQNVINFPERDNTSNELVNVDLEEIKISSKKVNSKIRTQKKKILSNDVVPVKKKLKKIPSVQTPSHGLKNNYNNKTCKLPVSTPSPSSSNNYVTKPMAAQKSVKNKTLPIYKQHISEDEETDLEDLYTIMSSPNKLKKYKRKNIRKKTKLSEKNQISFHLFTNSSSMKNKPKRRKKLYPRTKNEINSAALEPKENTKTKRNRNKAQAVCEIKKTKQLPGSNIVIHLQKEQQQCTKPPNIVHENDKFASVIHVVENIPKDSKKIFDENNVNYVEIDRPLLMNLSHKNLEEQVIEKQINNCFGFNCDEENNLQIHQTCSSSSSSSLFNKLKHKSSNKSIKILSDVVLNDAAAAVASEEDDKYFNESSLFPPIKMIQNNSDCLVNTPKIYPGPGANSTMIRPSSVDVAAASKSWRLDDNLFHFNPYFLKVKESCLPAIDQDSIIDHKFDEKKNNIIILDQQQQQKRTTILKNVPPERETTIDNINKKKQKSMVDFVENSEIGILKSDDYNKVNKQLSFFQVDELSPLKKNNDGRNDDGSSSNRQQQINLLGIENNQKIIMATSKKDLSFSTKQKQKKSPRKFLSTNKESLDKSAATTSIIFNKVDEEPISSKKSPLSSIENIERKNDSINRQTIPNNSPTNDNDDYYYNANNFKNLKKSPVVVSSANDTAAASRIKIIEKDEENELDLKDCFGFDSLLVVEDDILPINANKSKVPTRIILKEIKDVVVENDDDDDDDVPEEIVIAINNTNHSRLENDEENKTSTDNNNTPDENETVGLFEDLKMDLKPCIKKYHNNNKCPAKRKLRVQSCTSDDDSGDDSNTTTRTNNNIIVVQTPKKRKKKFTIKEEQEFEKWAEDFNSQCKRIENYKLEIEPN